MGCWVADQIHRWPDISARLRWYSSSVDIPGWDERYRTLKRRQEDLDAPPTPLLTHLVMRLTPGKALDLACGTGRNAIFLAQHGWEVKAIDGSEAAIQLLRQRARAAAVAIDAEVADLQASGLKLNAETWDLIAMCYYLQRDLFAKAKEATVPGGRIVAIAHTVEGNETPTATRLAHGELEQFFTGWIIEHRYEGKPEDPAHRRSVAEIVATKPRLHTNV